MMKRFLQRKNTRMYHVWLRSFMVCLCLALAGVSAWGQDAENWIYYADTEWANSEPYTITTADQLAGLAQLVNGGNNFEGKTITLGSDIDLSGKEWTPIGNFDHPFSGTFDGSNKIISNLYIKEEDGVKGLFGAADKATIQNVILNSAYIEGKSNLGSILGRVTNGGSVSIKSCNIKAIQVKCNDIDAFSSTMIGGIAGQFSGMIENCSIDNESLINNPGTETGGIVGRLNNGTISNSINNAVIKSKSYAGGVAGLNKGEIKECINYGSIETSSGSTGGIVGENSTDAVIEQGVNNGKINATQNDAGGIAGITKGTIKNCINYADVETKWYGGSTGGIVGKCRDDATIENCFNVGKVILNKQGMNKRGGIVGNYDNGTISSSYAFVGKDVDLEAIGERSASIAEGAYVIRDGITNGEVVNFTFSDEVPTPLSFKFQLKAADGYTLKEPTLSPAGEIIKEGDTYGFNFSSNDITILSEAEKIKYTVTATVSNDSKDMGVVEGGGEYAEGDLVIITATPNEGYELDSWGVEGVTEATKEGNTIKFTMPASNVTISAKFKAATYDVIATVATGCEKMGTVIGSGKYTKDTEVTITATPKEGYEFKSWTVESRNVTLADENQATTTFTMPAADVIVCAIFKEKETPTDPEEPVDPPVDPINYYNIYNETTYDFIDVSFSRNVVREGGSVNVYLEIPEGLDPAAVTLMFKRGMYNNWETLDEGVQPGEYPINNIWSHIYVKAVVDESYIDPEPDENHIYIDLSETNDSIWLYTDHKLVEEGKTAVIQAEVAKSCQNKEIRYMYKRTVLGNWQEMPKDYSINKYVVRDITTDIYVKAYFVFDKQDPTTAKNPHHVYADITATCEGLYLDATRHKVADEGDTKVFLYVKKGFETKDARYLFKRGLKGEWEDLVPGIEQNTFQVTDIEGDIYLKGIDAVYTGTEDIDGMVRVYTKDGSLFVYTAQPEEISVVSMTGVTVKRTRQTGLQSYPLNQGIYVICVGEQVFKVRVK